MHGSQLVLLALLALLAAPHLARGDDADCSGHGQLLPGSSICNCTAPLPSATDAIGYAGDICDVPVYDYTNYYVTANQPVPSALTACTDGPCTTLNGSARVCFWTDLGSLLSFPYHFGLLLQVDPNAPTGSRFDLYGLLASSDPSKSTYPNSNSSWNFATSVSSANPAAHFKLGQDEVAGGASGDGGTGVYVCVDNQGTETATFNLAVAMHSCPFTLLPPKGNLAICSSTPTDVRTNESASCPSGTCTCEGIYQRPQAAVFPDLGFSECSAACTPLGTRESVEQQQPGTWRFFNFSILEGERFIAASATASTNTSSDLELYLKFWQPPGRQGLQFDARSEPGDFRSSASSADLSSSIRLSADDVAYREGTWFLGAWVSGDAPVSYSVELYKAACPNACSGSDRGACNTTVGQCTCSSSTFGDDCSGSYSEVAAGAGPLVLPPRPAFDVDHILVPGLAALLSGGSASVTIEASFTTGVSLPAWVSCRPSLLISGSGMANDSFPTLESAEHRLVMFEVDNKRSLKLESSQVLAGELRMTMDNPFSFPFTMGYTVTVTVKAKCIKECSGHGTCSSTGTCECQGPFVGIDCSVDPASLRECVEGSLRRTMDVGVAHGDAYAVCVCTNDPSLSGTNSCTFPEPYSSKRAVILCHETFGIKGSSVSNGVVLSNGAKVATGGVCWHTERRGESPGMVFFWCLLSVTLAAALVVGGKHGWSYYQAQGFAEGGGYSELPGGRSLMASFLGAFMRRGAGSNNDPW